MTLREDQHAFAKALVGAGRFPSVSAALQILLQRRANGTFISGDQLRARFAAQPDERGAGGAGGTPPDESLLVDIDWSRPGGEV